MPGKRKSAGLLLYRIRDDKPQVLLVHPGGPYWAKKDVGAWTIPKGEFEDGEDSLAAARREFHEETGMEPAGEFVALRALRQPSGKMIHAWAFEGDADADAMRSNLFSMQWPPKSGQLQEFPEADRAAWFAMDEARMKLIAGQRPFLDELESLLDAKRP
jgi:predicted NUDIX family NTP pyrophosphohydrolase